MILTYIKYIIASMTAVIAFSVLFHAPKKQWIFCGITGTIGWVVYSLMLDMGFGLVAANFTATLLLTMFSRVISIIRKCPITVFLVPGIFPLVPGAGIYYTAYYFFMGDTKSGAAKGSETVLVAGAITLGILFGSLLLQKSLRRLAKIFEHHDRQKETA